MQKVNFNFNWPLVGNIPITKFLEKSIVNDRVAGAYIFHGPDNLGKTTAARYFAQGLLCENKQKASGDLPCEICPSCRHFQVSHNKRDSKISHEDIDINAHGDFHIIRKEKDKKNISVEQVRELIRILSMSSFLGLYKIGIIKHAESLSIEAANALLKTLEEPRLNVVIILVTHDIDFLPATIISRSQILNFYPVQTDIIYDYLIKKHKASRSAAKNFSRLCLGRSALAVKFLEDKDFYDSYNKKVKQFFNIVSHDINGRFLAVEKLMGKKAIGQEAVVLAKRILEVWQGLLRDCLLFELGHNDLIQHQLAEEEIKKIKNKFVLSDLLNLNNVIRQAEDYLMANVSPKLVLGNVAVNI